MGSESGGDPADLVGDRCKQKGFPSSKPSSCFPMSAAPVLEGRHFSPKRMTPLWPWKESLYQWKEKMCWEESKGYLWDSGAVSRKDLCKKPGCLPPWGVTQVWAGAIGYCELWSTEHHLPWAVSRQWAGDAGWAGAPLCRHKWPSDWELLDPTFSALKQEWGHSQILQATSLPQTCMASNFLKFVSQLLGCFAAGDTPVLLGLCLARWCQGYLCL